MVLAIFCISSTSNSSNRHIFIDWVKYLFNKCNEEGKHIGKRKPHKETFEWVLNDMGYAAEDVLFIEDSPQHIEGAKTINLNTLYLTQERSLEEIESWL